MTRQKTVRKLRLIASSMILALLIILGRLMYLQGFSHNLFVARSNKNFLRMETIPSMRGNIVDCHGNLLATNRPLISIYWNGTGQRTLSNEQRALFHATADACNIQLNEILEQNVARVERTKKIYKLAQNVSFEQVCKITELFGNHPNLHMDTQFQRYYPYKTLACHVLGYISHNVEQIGKMGLEKTFEDLLRGQEGLRIKTINSLGSKLHEQAVRESLMGGTVATTLDLSLQQLAESVFGVQHTGALVLLDPIDGAIKALVSRPHFDPSIFLEQLSASDWQNLQEKKPFINRALNACYPPASLFKLVTLALGIEKGLIKPDELWHCKGYVTFAKRRYHCANREGHGYVTIPQAIEKSCNTLFYHTATQISIDLLAEYAHYFGLGRKTGIILPENQGLVPTSAWKKTTIGERWWPGETLSAAIGQSYLLVTPLQIACMIGSICTGMLVHPRILLQEAVEKQPLALAPSTRKLLKRAMKLVAMRGTGSRVGSFPNTKLYAKTGTAQTAELAKRHMGNVYREHGWFALHFQHREEQPLTLIILLEHTGSSRPATAMARQFMQGYQRLCS